MAEERDTTLPAGPLAELRLRRPPFWIIAIALIAVVLSWLPLVVVARRRVSTTPYERIHLFQDMDNQVRLDPQEPNPIFADGRAERPVITGTVARGELEADHHYYRGYIIQLAQQGEQPQVTFLEGYPQQLQITEAFVRRGQQQYAIYCAPCHGIDGYGTGPVHYRATDLQQPQWVPPASLHSDLVRNRPEGHLYNTINNGIRNMPAHGPQISTRDRWAIVAYMRALQVSQGQQQQQAQQAEATQ